jgi:AcrR family transcriptional regulator
LSPTLSTPRPTLMPNAAKNRSRRSNDTLPKRRGTGRTVRGRHARQRLLSAAQRVFERDGFLHARIADICAEAGMAQPSFYTYFVSKEQIFDEVVSTVELDMLAMPGRGEASDPIGRIRDANRHYLTFYRDHARILAVIDQRATFDEETKTARAERHERFARAIERRIRRHQRDGLVSRHIDPYFAAKALGGMVTAMASHLFLDNTCEDLNHAIEQLTLLWTNALGVTTQSPGI